MQNLHPYIVNSHARYSVQFTHGEGMYLYAEGGKKYLDFMAGIAVNSLGHNNKKIVKSIVDQASKVMHVSNVFYSEIMDECAKTICTAAGMKNAFFCNSGAEAIETAIKMARKYFYDKSLPQKNEIITFHGAFHGRTMAAISSMSDESYKQGFYPLLPGFKYVEYGNAEALKNAIDDKTAAIMLEPIQGEGGLTFCGWEYLQSVAKIASNAGILLIADEIQSGAGRTGRFLASQHAGVIPDIVAMAKGIGGGFPVGVTLFSEKTKDVMTVGSHGTTFGGNPLAMAVANTVCREINQAAFLENINKVANYLHVELQNLRVKFPDVIEEIRGFGLMVGFKCNDAVQSRDLAHNLLDHGLITMPARGNVIRLLPPLIVTKGHVDEAIAIIKNVISL